MKKHRVKFTDVRGNVIVREFECKSDAIKAVLRAAKRALIGDGHITITINELDDERMSILFKRADEYIDAVTL